MAIAHAMAIPGELPHVGEPADLCASGGRLVLVEDELDGVEELVHLTAAALVQGVIAR